VNQDFSSALRSMPESEKTIALMRMAERLAHELNNIFTAVIGNVALLDESKIPGAEGAIAELRKGIERGIELSSNLEAFAGTHVLRRSHIDINRTIEETILPLRQSLLSGFDVEMKLSRPSCIAFIDEGKFRSCLFEIARNASRSMHGMGKLTVEARPLSGGRPLEGALEDADADEVEINITDSGIGMPPEVAEHTMERMFGTGPSHVGRDWCLSKVAGFIRQSGGRMGLRSVPDLGTSISLRLPVMAVCEI
jgi:signal transduction histidine kinase